MEREYKEYVSGEKDEELDKTGPYSSNDLEIVNYIKNTKIFNSEMFKADKKLGEVGYDAIFNQSVTDNNAKVGLELLKQSAMEKVEKICLLLMKKRLQHLDPKSNEIIYVQKYLFQKLAKKILSLHDGRYKYKVYMEAGDLAQFIAQSLYNFPDLREYYRNEFFRNWNLTIIRDEIDFNVSILMMTTLSLVIKDSNPNDKISVFSISDAWNYLTDVVNFWIR
jgi:hypothetical protein